MTLTEKDLSEKIEKSIRENDWDFGNKVLYDLCTHNFEHKEDKKIIAKVWLIGRAYAASVERQRTISDNNSENISAEKYYKDFIAPRLKESEIDAKLLTLKASKRINYDNLKEILNLHSRLIEILKDDPNNKNKQNRRSFSSKYLHFHLPELFFIYDSIAYASLNKYKLFIDTNSLKKLKKEYKDENVDPAYTDFFLACYLLKEHINEEHDERFNCRNLDNLLLYYS